MTITQATSGVWRTFVRSRLLMKVGVGILVVMVLAGIFVPMVTTYGPYDDTGAQLHPPSAQFWFGTDNLGRDVFVRSFAAARVDIGLAVAGVVIAMLVGTAIGAYAAMTRHRSIRGLIMLVISGINAFPGLVLLLAVVSVLGGGLVALLVALTVGGWTRYAVLTETRATIVRRSDFVSALSVLGYSRPRIIFLHIIPNVVGESFAYAVSEFTIVILAIGTLSFLGSGVQPPTPEWGAMISAGRLYLVSAPWMTWGPGLLLVLTGLGAGLIGEARRRGRHV